MHNGNEQDTEQVSLLISSAGHLSHKSQTVDYQFQGAGLESYNFWDFMVQTYEEKQKPDTSVCTVTDSENRQ